MVGIDVSPGSSGNQVLTLFKASSEFLTTSDLPFGTANTVFITGVAYQDANSNGVYDPGEGISGVTVTPSKGDWHAVTSTSGGYAIPVPANSGTYTLTATGGPLNGATATVTVGADSVKADWVLPAAAVALPPQVPVAASDGSTQLAVQLAFEVKQESLSPSPSIQKHRIGTGRRRNEDPSGFPQLLA